MIYYDPEAGHCGINELKRKTGSSTKKVEEFLHEKDVYTRFNPVVRKFTRRRVFVPHDNDQFDTFNVQFSKHNDLTNYLITVTHSFNKYTWDFPIKIKTTSEEVVQAFKQVFKERVPKFILTYEDEEFTRKMTQELFNDYDFKWFTRKINKIKSAIADIFNRSK